MSQTNKPIELLLALNVAEGTSKKNIQTYINKLQKDLSINLELQYSMDNSAIEGILDSLQTALQELPLDLVSESISYGLQDTYEQVLQLDEALMSLNTTWSTLASQSSGGLTLTQELVVLSQGMQEAAGSSENLIDIMGFADSGFSLLGTNLLNTSKEMSEFIEDQRTVTTVTSAADTSTSGLTTRLTALATAANVAKVAIKGFAIATGVGLAYAAVGFVIEKTVGAVVAKMGESKRQAEEVAAANKELLNSYSQNKQQIDSLVSKYGELSDKMKESNPDNATIKEYRDIQDEIGKLLPSLATGTDEYGRKIISSHEAIKIKIDLLKEELEIEREKARLEAETARNERIKVNEKTYDDSRSEIKSELQRFALFSNDGRTTSSITSEYVIALVDEKGNPIYDSFDELGSKLLPELESKLKRAKLHGSQEDIHYLEKMIFETKNFIKELNNTEIQAKSSSVALKRDYISAVEDIISKNNSFNDNAKTLSQTLSAQLINATNIDDVKELRSALEGLFSNPDTSSLVNGIDNEFNRLKNSTGDNFDSVANSVKSNVSSFSSELSKLGLTQEEVAVITNALNSKVLNAIAYFAQFKDVANTTGKTVGQVAIDMNGLPEGIDETSESVDTLTTKISKFKDDTEEMAGISSSYVESLNDLLFKYDMLTNQLSSYSHQQLQDIYNKKELSAEEQYVKSILEERLSVMKELSSVYPDLLGKDGTAIALSDEKRAAIEKENKANEVLLKAYKLARDGKLTYEQEMTLAAAEESRNRISYLEAEITALELLLMSYNGMSNSMQSAVDAGALTMDDEMKNLKSWMDESSSPDISHLQELRTLMAELKSTFDGNIKSISGYSDAVEKSEKSTSKSNSSTKESIYIIDEYAEAIRNLNALIQQQEALRKGLPEHSEAYRQSLQNQIKLEQEKLALQEKQAQALERQIATGQIKQTGNITVDSTSTAPQKLSGWNGRITSQYGNRTSPTSGQLEFHRGVDIAGAKGTRLDSNVNGKVVSAGWHNSYGNNVTIIDDKGVKHLYAHLDKIAAKVGDTVKAGTHIGNIGSTGNSTGSHLHYEVSNNGKLIDPNTYLSNAKNGTVTAGTNANAAVSTSQESIDRAKAALDALRGEMLDQKQTIADLQKETIDSYTAKFDDRRQILEDGYAFEEAKLKNINRDSSKYNATLDKQVDILKRKQNVDKEEIAFYEELIQQGGLSQIVIDELNKKIINLKTSMQSSQNEIGAKQLEDRTSAREYNLGKQDQVIEYEKAKIQELDKSSQRYALTLEKINKHTNRKMLINQKDLDELNQLIASGEYSGEVLQAMKNDASALTVEIKNLAQEINNNNFEIVANIKANADEQVDDLSDKINVLKTIRNLYKEGSADYLNNAEEEIKLQQELAEVHDKTRRQQAEKLKDLALYPEQIKQATEMMEDSTAAYWNAKVAVDQLTKSLEESKKKLLDDTANKVINAYKEYVQERRDQHIDMIDQELEKEKEAFDKRKKAIQDELDLFRRSVQEKIQLLDRQEAARSYQMDIDELESERTQIVDQIDILALDDSYEAKAKRKQLQEQLDNIDKNISEKRHSRDIDLQKESLNDLLTDKEDNMREREELEDEHYQKKVARLEKEKENLQKHYNDLLNDERKFTKIRTDIANKHYDEVIAQLNGYIDEMNLTMPELATTLDGTMITIGTSIRENVIDSLEDAIDAINKLRDLRQATPNGIENFDPNEPKKNPPGTNPPSAGGSNTSSLNGGDYQVLFGKFLSDIVRKGLPMGEARDALKNEANRLAAEGRLNHSEIKANSSFDTEFKKLSKQEQEALKNYIRQNANILNGSYQDRIHSSIDSLSTNRPTAIIANSNTATLAKIDTTSLLENSKFSDGLTTRLSAISDNFSSIMQAMSSPFQSLVASTAASADTITVNFNIDKMNGDMNDLKKFNKMMNDELLRKKGIK